MTIKKIMNNKQIEKTINELIEMCGKNRELIFKLQNIIKEKETIIEELKNKTIDPSDL